MSISSQLPHIPLSQAGADLRALALSVGQNVDARVGAQLPNGLTQVLVGRQTLSLQLPAPQAPGTTLTLAVRQAEGQLTLALVAVRPPEQSVTAPLQSPPSATTVQLSASAMAQPQQPATPASPPPPVGSALPSASPQSAPPGAAVQAASTGAAAGVNALPAGVQTGGTTSAAATQAQPPASISSGANPGSTSRARQCLMRWHRRPPVRPHKRPQRRFSSRCSKPRPRHKLASTRRRVAVRRLRPGCLLTLQPRRMCRLRSIRWCRARPRDRTAWSV
jgi:hypothetical protein